MKITNLINKYLERTLIYRSEGTYQYYLKTSKSVIKALEYNNLTHVTDLKESSQTDILLYYKKISSKKNSQINADISFLYTVLNYYQSNHKMTPYEKLIDDTTPFRAINDDDLRKLINWLKTLDINQTNNLSWKLVILLSLESGVRMNELLNVKTENVDLISNTILLETTKSGKNRVVFFDILSRDLIKFALEQKKEYLIWNHNKNERMKRAGLFYFYDMIQTNLNFDRKITSHRLRKTFATRLLKSGCPLTTIQKLLGHGDIKMTMKYLEIDKAMIENDYFKFYPYDDLI